jgi:hypothetical protein
MMNPMIRREKPTFESYSSCALFTVPGMPKSLRARRAVAFRFFWSRLYHRLNDDVWLPLVWWNGVNSKVTRMTGDST